jgi:uncharacterized membrane protein
MKQGRVAQPLKLLTLHFDPAVLGDSFMRLQENSLIKELFTQALRGIILSPATSVMALALMQKLKTAPAYEHLYLLMQLLTIIAISDDKTFITRPAAKSNYNKTDEQRLTRVYLFTLDNFFVMKVIIAEKPSVAREIAKVFGATTKKDGYMEG